MMNIPGLPEGVECVRIGRAKPDDFEIYGRSICKGIRMDSASQVIVRPQEGYEFVPCAEVDGQYFVSKKFDAAVEITISAKFSVTNTHDQKTITDAATALRSLPGYVG